MLFISGLFTGLGLAGAFIIWGVQMRRKGKWPWASFLAGPAVPPAPPAPKP